MKKLHDDGLLESFNFQPLEMCEACLLGKMKKRLFAAIEILELVGDVCGPVSTTS